MSVNRRADGRYIVKYKTTAGWKQKSFRNLPDAEAFDKEMQYDQDAEECTRLTVAESMTAYLKVASICDKRVEHYLRLSKYLGTSFCSQYVDELGRRDLETARDILRDKNLSNYSINRYTGMLVTVWRWCVSEDLLKTVPWERYRKLPEGRHGHWMGSQEDFFKVYSLCPEYMRWFIRTSLALCCRPGQEVVSLRWKHIHLEQHYAEVWMPKVKSQKIVQLPGWWIDEARQRRSADEDRVCPGYHNGAWNPSAIWRDYCEKGNVSHCPLYTIRHFAASRMLEAGADLAAVAAQLGHKNITTTGQFYTHAIEGAQTRAAAMLPAPSSLVQEVKK